MCLWDLRPNNTSWLSTHFFYYWEIEEGVTLLNKNYVCRLGHVTIFFKGDVRIYTNEIFPYLHHVHSNIEISKVCHNRRFEYHILCSKKGLCQTSQV